MKSLNALILRIRISVGQRAMVNLSVGVVLLILLSLVGASAQGVFAARSSAQSLPEDVPWTLYHVDSPKLFYNMTDRSMKFDSAGRPHVVYGGDHLYYAWYDGEKWNKTTIDTSTQVGQYAALAFDNSDRPRVSYYDAANGDLKFAYVASDGQWHIITLDGTAPAPAAPANPVEKSPQLIEFLRLSEPRWPGGSLDEGAVFEDAAPSVNGTVNLGRFTSIAVGTDNIVHISYHDDTHGILKYASWNGVTWFITEVDRNTGAESDVGEHSSIALNGSNQPRISYMDEKYDNLKFASSNNGGNTWDTQDVENGKWENPGVGPFSSLVIDKNGKAHISYLDFYNYDLKYATNKKGSWQHTVVDDGKNVGWYTSIAMDSSGDLRISYYDRKNGDLKRASYRDGSWSEGTQYSGGDVGLFTSVDYDHKDRPAISFYARDTGTFYFSHKDDSGWRASIIDYSADVGGISTSVDISDSNIAHISYYDGVSQNLRHAGNFGQVWLLEVVASSGNVGSYSSLKLDSRSQPTIAYHDASNGYLKYAYDYEGDWAFLTVDKDGDVGAYISYVIDNIGRLHMSYYDDSRADLNYAMWDGNWHYWSLDTNGDVGKYTSIAADSANRPYIAYYDGTNKNIKFAFLSPTDVWLTEVIDDNGDVGMFASLSLSPFGQPRVSYYDEANGDLKYAVKSGSTWTKEVVDSGGDVGRYTSLAVDSNGDSHISYYDVTNADLKYAVGNGSWQIETVDSAGDVGRSTSLALTKDDEPGISYYDYTNGDLKFAAGFELPTLEQFYFPIVIK